MQICALLNQITKLLFSYVSACKCITLSMCVQKCFCFFQLSQGFWHFMSVGISSASDQGEKSRGKDELHEEHMFRERKKKEKKK